MAGPFHRLPGAFNHRPVAGPCTSQFVVRVYPTLRGQRVVVDGISHFDEDREEQVEARAREIILQRLEAFLPHRPVPDPEPGRSAVLFYDIALTRVEGPAQDGEGSLGPQAPLPRLLPESPGRDLPVSRVERPPGRARRS